MATAPSATPAAPKRSGPGCLFVGIALPVVILIGVVIGTTLDSPDEPPEEVRVEVAAGTTADGTEWQVEAVRDIEGELCAFLLADGVELTGGCGEAADDATFGEETVVFGHLEGDADTARVVLNDAEVIEIETEQIPDFPGRWFATLVDRDVDVEKLES